MFLGKTVGWRLDKWQSCTATWGACDKGNVLEHIIKSLRPIALLVSGAVVFVLGTAFSLASDATLASSASASGDLAQAGRWLQFLGALCALAAVCTAGWERIMRSDWVASAEIAAAALGTLLLMIGLLSFAASNGSSAAGSVTGAMGIGIWALLVLSRAARASLAEQASAHGGANAAPSPAPGQHQQNLGRYADLWLAAAIGLFVWAIGFGFTSAAGSPGAGFAAGLLQAIGVGLLAWAVASARKRQMLGASPVPRVLAGLALLAASFLIGAIVAALALGTPTALGAGLAVTAAVELAAIVTLGLAAWTRVREVYR